MSQTRSDAFHSVFDASDSFDVENLNFSERSSTLTLDKLPEEQRVAPIYTETKDEESNIGNNSSKSSIEDGRESTTIDDGRGQYRTPVVDIDDFIKRRVQGDYTGRTSESKPTTQASINFKKLAVDVAKEVYKRAGYNLTQEQADYISNAKDEFKSLVDVIDLLKPSYHSKEVEELNEFLENGGNYHDWFTHNSNIVDDFTYVPYEGAYGEEIAIIELYYKVVKNLSEEEAMVMIKAIPEKDIVNIASQASERLEELKRQREQELLEYQSLRKKKYLEQVALYKENVRNYVKSSNFDVNLNITLSEKEKNEFIKFVSEFNAEGKSRFMLSLDEFENMIKLALLAYKKKHLEKATNKPEEVKTGLGQYVN